MEVGSWQFHFNSFYLAGTMCAKHKLSSTCFAAGDLSSQLRAKDEEGRFYVESFQSFVKGCDSSYPLEDSQQEEQRCHPSTCSKEESKDCRTNPESDFGSVLDTTLLDPPPPPQKCAKLSVREGEASEAL